MLLVKIAADVVAFSSADSPKSARSRDVTDSAPPGTRPAAFAGSWVAQIDANIHGTIRNRNATSRMRGRSRILRQ